MLAKAGIEINIGNPDKALKNIEQAMKIELQTIQIYQG